MQKNGFCYSIIIDCANSTQKIITIVMAVFVCAIDVDCTNNFLYNRVSQNFFSIHLILSLLSWNNYSIAQVASKVKGFLKKNKKEGARAHKKGRGTPTWIGRSLVNG